MELADIPIYVYPILFILLVIIVAVVSLLVGKRKYNKDNGIVKEKKVKEPKQKTGKKLKRAEPETAARYTDEFDSDEDYDNAVESLKAKPAAKPKQEVVEGPVIVVDENKVNEEEVIEWKPPADDKKAVSEPTATESVPGESVQNSNGEQVSDNASSAADSENSGNLSAAGTGAAVSAAAAVLPDEPSESDWNDEDLELFEARTYAFDEETQSGYMTDKTEAKDKKPEESPAESIYAFRERKEPSRNPADDEGVQIIEEEKPEPIKPTPKEAPKVSNSKYAYFDAVMEKEKSENVKAEEPEQKWQPPQQRSADAPASGTSASETSSKSKKSMQYIELDLDDKE
ncbi:hypothetical protein MmiAt1_05710 [Methanimicrococcus sp. At1]|uniref:Uncharacterized protein n=2 Tax=Methanimicrococcus hacksteinii TaxID=3028293 RepID=A0ABU3VNN2_9EURY|nr:hypothetical protein [Methanimicrococcus sp. At1]